MNNVTELLVKYPDRIPVELIVCDGLATKFSNFKKKYLVPCEQTLGFFIMFLKKKVNISDKEGIFFIIKGTVPKINSSMKTIYRDFKDDDNLLRINIMVENTFGT